MPPPIDWTTIIDPTAPLPAGTRARARAQELRSLYQSAMASHAQQRAQVSTPETVAAAMSPYAIGRATESAWVLPVDARGRACSAPIEITRGTADGCDMSPRDVYRAALRTGLCVGIVVGHNHPTGDPSPSPSDIAITKRLIQAGRSVDIVLHDHVTLTPVDGRFVSIRRERPDLWS